MNYAKTIFQLCPVVVVVVGGVVVCGALNIMHFGTACVLPVKVSLAVAVVVGDFAAVQY